ncbi:MAG TPA: translocation/assembly module TamB domain-containing protein, partial [Magnetospirillaceae bacterium]|nr:translocation/assembly module TamB domain-containing protein [Magnetospirillaceae bacterium]
AEPKASLSIIGSADLPSLWHSRADLAIKRLDGEGEYKLHAVIEGDGSQVEIDAEEPPQGLMASLADLPDLGRLRLHATLAGPPDAEKIQFNLTAGQLTGEGHGTADFKGRRLDLDLGVQSPAMTPRPGLSWKSAKLEAHVHGAFDQPEAQGHLLIEAIASGGSGLDRVEADLQGKDGKASVSARLIGLHPEGVPAKFLGTAPVEMTAETTLTGEEKPVAFTLSHPLLQAQGKTALTEGAPISAEATVPDLAALAPLTGVDIHGRATLKGQYDAKGRVSVEGRVGELLHLTADGTVGPSFDLRWSVQAADMAKLGAPVPGAVNAKGSLQGSAARFTASAEAQGRLAEAPLTLSLKLERSGGATHIDIGRARWKSVEAGGKLDLAPKKDNASGSIQAKIGDLGDFSPFAGLPLTGSAEAKLEMAQGKAPRAVIQADLRQVTWPSGTLGHLAVEGSVEDPIGHPVTALHFAAEQLQAAGFSGNATLAAEGPETALKLSLSADLQGPQGPAKLAAESVAALPKKTLQLTSLQAAYEGETAKLLAPATLAYGGPVTVSGLRLADGPAELDIEGQAAPDLALDVRLKKTDLAALQRFFPNLKIKGSLSAEARLQGQAAQVKLRVDSGKNGAVEVAGSVPLQSDGTLDLTAKGALDLALIEPLLAAEGREARGKVTLEAKISGPMAAPVINGGAELQAVSLQDYAQGLHLSDIEGKLQVDNGVLRLSGVSGKAGPGKFTLEGTIGVLQPKVPLDLTLVARDARPLASDLLTADLNADLKLGGTVADGMALSGKVTVKRAEINIPASLPPTVATLKVKKKGAPPQPPEPAGVKMALDVSVDAPEQIFVRGRGVDAEMGGKLQARGTSDDPQIQGGFDLRHGTYNLAGQTMSVTRGRISFDGGGPGGNLDPALDLTVESSSNGIDATLAVTGYADAPVLKLSSSPDLPQDEILARLLFNESVSQLTPLQMASIAQGVAQMSGVGGGFDPMALLRKNLGIDRLSVSSSGNSGQGNSNTMVEAGKYVASGVYVGTRQGLNGGTQARVQVDLTRHLKLDTLIGTGGGTPATGTTIDNDPGSSLGLTYQFDY